MKFKFKKAFTLVELITVIAILGTLVGVSTQSYNGYREMAEREEEKLAIQQVRNAVDNYYSANQEYPTTPLGKQPTADTPDATGNIVKGYSKVDIGLLVSQRYLQEAPTLKGDQFYAVHYNGLVTIEDTFNDSLIIEDGNLIVEKKANDTLKVSVYADNKTSDRKATSVSVVEVNSSGNNKGTAVTLSLKDSSQGRYEGNIRLTDGNAGAKYFRATIKYSNGETVRKDASIEYAMSSQQVDSKPYWVPENASAAKPNTTTSVQMKSEHIKTQGTSYTLDWNSYPIESFGYIISGYEIKKTWNDGESHTEVFAIDPDKRTYTDNEVKGGVAYTYEISAISNSLKSSNVLVARPTNITYTDTLADFYNVTKNDYSASFAETIMFNVGDKEKIKNVTVHVGTVKDGALKSTGTVNGVTQYYTAYKLGENNRRFAEKKTITDAYGKKVEIDIYTYALSVEVADEYIVYWVEIEDICGYKTYCYYNPSLAQGSNETVEQAEDRRTVVSKTKPSITKSSKDDKWTIMRGLVKIFEDPYVDNSKIDDTNSNYKLYGGKVYLP